MNIEEIIKNIILALVGGKQKAQKAEEPQRTAGGATVAKATTGKRVYTPPAPKDTGPSPDEYATHGLNKGVLNFWKDYEKFMGGINTTGKAVDKITKGEKAFGSDAEDLSQFS